jgi:hypothetical protein
VALESVSEQLIYNQLFDDGQKLTGLDFERDRRKRHFGATCGPLAIRSVAPTKMSLNKKSAPSSMAPRQALGAVPRIVRSRVKRRPGETRRDSPAC